MKAKVGLIRCSCDKNEKIRKSSQWRMNVGSLEEPGSLLQLGQQQDAIAHQHK
jgi:hypothetical protein